jgi:hypothetical protein
VRPPPPPLGFSALWINPLVAPAWSVSVFSVNKRLLIENTDTVVRGDDVGRPLTAGAPATVRRSGPANDIDSTHRAQIRAR